MIAAYFISLLFQEILIDGVGQSDIMGECPSHISWKITKPKPGLVNVEGKQNGNLWSIIFKVSNNRHFIFYNRLSIRFSNFYFFFSFSNFLMCAYCIRVSWLKKKKKVLYFFPRNWKHLWDELIGEVSSLTMQSPDTKITWDLFKYFQQHMRYAKFRRERWGLHVCWIHIFTAIWYSTY